jgi:hypothetical protein
MEKIEEGKVRCRTRTGKVHPELEGCRWLGPCRDPMRSLFAPETAPTGLPRSRQKGEARLSAAGDVRLTV